MPDEIISLRVDIETARFFEAAAKAGFGESAGDAMGFAVRIWLFEDWAKNYRRERTEFANVTKVRPRKVAKKPRPGAARTKEAMKERQIWERRADAHDKPPGKKTAKKRARK